MLNASSATHLVQIRLTNSHCDITRLADAFLDQLQEYYNIHTAAITLKKKKKKKTIVSHIMSYTLTFSICMFKSTYDSSYNTSVYLILCTCNYFFFSIMLLFKYYLCNFTRIIYDIVIHIIWKQLYIYFLFYWNIKFHYFLVKLKINPRKVKHLLIIWVQVLLENHKLKVFYTIKEI